MYFSPHRKHLPTSGDERLICPKSPVRPTVSILSTERPVNRELVWLSSQSTYRCQPSGVSYGQRCRFESRSRCTMEASACTAAHKAERRSASLRKVHWKLNNPPKKRSHNLPQEKCPIFETLQATKPAFMKTEVIRVFTPCRLGHTYRHFGDAQCFLLHSQLEYTNKCSRN
jgi:hypothetical protein